MTLSFPIWCRKDDFLVKCADCGWSMRFATNKANKTPYSYYSCSFYGQFGKELSGNIICVRIEDKKNRWDTPLSLS